MTRAALRKAMALDPDSYEQAFIEQPRRGQTTRTCPARCSQRWACVTTCSKPLASTARPDPATGLRKARLLAAELDKAQPDAAGSLREGLEDMFTVRRLGIDGTLARTPTSRT
jgi:hypothetical protein